MDAGFKELSRKFDGIGKYFQVIDAKADQHAKLIAENSRRIDNPEK